MFDRKKLISGIVLSTLTAAVLVTAPVVVLDASPAAAAEEKAKKHPGKTVYARNTCMACHGKDGKKSIQDYPNLAGQDKKYMISQIEDILSGKRTAGNDATGHPRTEGMRGALVTPEGTVRINAEQIEQVSDWLASMDPADPTPLETPLTDEQAKEGEKLYKKAKCQTCHGADGTKPLKGYPYIAGQKKAYIINQMNDVKNKIRDNGKIKTMYAFVKKMTDEEIDLLAAYLSQIDRNKK
ncbi:MAG: c-type cytochrome [Alphaproteobacteria bacterium]|nr:c-type cytochrome [Alphaproteobacteria bacterium]